VFAACAVEAVEAFTILLAVGLTRGWRSTLAGAGAALLVLAVFVAVASPLLTVLPLQALRLVVGAVLLVYGLQWLRKAILRSSGRKPLHDEAAIFAREKQAARDAVAFTVAFKGVLLEGFEVVVIVATLGATGHHTLLAALAALAAIAVVALAGLAVRAPLSRVQENTLKYAVGVVLTALGVFWAGEGSGVPWPGGDAAIIGLVAVVYLGSLAAVTTLRRMEIRA
jgi:uncharacterized membrane protein